MGRTEILKQITHITGVDKDTCAMVLDTFRDVVLEALVSNERVILPRFMSFEIIERSERETYDFQSGAKKSFPPVKIVKCNMSKEIRDTINGKQRD